MLLCNFHGKKKRKERKETEKKNKTTLSLGDKTLLYFLSDFSFQRNSKTRSFVPRVRQKLLLDLCWELTHFLAAWVFVIAEFPIHAFSMINTWLPTIRMLGLCQCCKRLRIIFLFNLASNMFDFVFRRIDCLILKLLKILNYLIEIR